MAFRIQAVQHADMGQILRDSVGMYGQIKGMQNASADRKIKAEALGVEKKNQEEDRAFRDTERTRVATERTAQSDRDRIARDIKDNARFTTESAQHAAVIKDLPLAQKLSATQRRIDDLKRRGIPTETTQRLFDMYDSGNPEVIAEADQAISERYNLGIQRGDVKAPKEKKQEQYRIASPEEKERAGITQPGVWQVSPKGQFVKAGGKEQAQYRIASPEEKERAGVTQPGVWQISPKGQFVKAGGKGQNITTNVNTGQAGDQLGTIPPGYAARRGQDGFEMYKVKGGPAEEKAKQLTEKKKKGEAQKQVYSDIVTDDAESLLSLYENETWYNPVSGITGDIASDKLFSGSAANDADALRETIESAGTVDRLLEIKATGATFGAISEKELGLLKAAKGNIRRGQSKEQTVKHIKRYIRLYKKVMRKVQADPDAAKYGFGPSSGNGPIMGGQVQQMSNPEASQAMPPEAMERYK